MVEPARPATAEFLDAEQYTPAAIAAYESIYGRDFVSPGGEAMARELIERLALAADARVLDVEMSMGQMIEDVKLAAEGTREIEFHGTAGGIVPSPDEVASKIRELVQAVPA